MLDYPILLHRVERLKRILVVLKEKYNFQPYTVSVDSTHISIQGDYDKLNDPIFELINRRNTQWTETLQGEHIWVDAKLGYVRLILTHD